MAAMFIGYTRVSCFLSCAFTPELYRCVECQAVEHIGRVSSMEVWGFIPLAGGRPYMASQIWHGKPLATTLNFSCEQ